MGDAVDSVDEGTDPSIAASILLGKYEEHVLVLINFYLKSCMCGAKWVLTAD